jgi:hypothetical protein
MDTQELIDRYQVGDRDFRWSDLTRADLSNVDLAEADLSGSDMTWANLQEANLRGAILEGADLSMANLTGADLTGTNLRGVYLRWARLDGAILDGADLQGAVVNDLKLAHARSLEGAILPNGVNHQPDLVQKLLPGPVPETQEIITGQDGEGQRSRYAADRPKRLAHFLPSSPPVDDLPPGKEGKP